MCKLVDVRLPWYEHRVIFVIAACIFSHQTKNIFVLVSKISETNVTMFQNLPALTSFWLFRNIQKLNLKRYKQGYVQKTQCEIIGFGIGSRHEIFRSWSFADACVLDQGKCCVEIFSSTQPFYPARGNTARVIPSACLYKRCLVNLMLEAAL